MNSSELYLRNNDFQRRDSSEIINKFSHYLKSSDNEDNSLLDIGCGPGDVLFDFIIPKMSRNCKITGIDVSNEMLECARENFGNESIKFHRVDISSILACQQLNNEQFNNITSFYCLHWIQNQEQTFANIHKLLRQNGTAIISFLVHTPLYDIYVHLSKINKYMQFMSDVKQFISPYHHEKRPQEIVKRYCESVGLVMRHIEISEKIYVYENVQHLREAVKAINPFTKRMPMKLQHDFLDDFIRLVDELTENRFHNNEKIISRYRLAVIVLTKN